MAKTKKTSQPVNTKKDSTIEFKVEFTTAPKSSFTSLSQVDKKNLLVDTE